MRPPYPSRSEPSCSNNDREGSDFILWSFKSLQVGIRSVDKFDDSLNDLPCIDACVFSLNSDDSLRCLCVDHLSKRISLRYYSRDVTGRWAHVVIIAMRAVLIALLICSHVFTESFFALFTHEGHFRCPCQWMRLCLGVTFGAVEPLLATRSTNGDLGI
jgi:hypothetical protein